MEPKYKINNEVKLKDGSKALITAIFQEDYGCYSYEYQADYIGDGRVSEADIVAVTKEDFYSK